MMVVKILLVVIWSDFIDIYSGLNCLCPTVKNPCKGTCSHLCLLRPEGYTCACPEGTSFFPGSSTECDTGAFILLICLYSHLNDMTINQFILAIATNTVDVNRRVPLTIKRYKHILLFSSKYSSRSHPFVFVMFDLIGFEPEPTMPPPCQCRNGGTCYFDDNKALCM